VEFPGGVSYGAGAEAAGVAEAGDAPVQCGQRALGGRGDGLGDVGGHGGLLDADLEQCRVVEGEPPEPEGARAGPVRGPVPAGALAGGRDSTMAASMSKARTPSPLSSACLDPRLV